jgi:HAD superfamily hydrolase (TIGR01509 family)
VTDVTLSAVLFDMDGTLVDSEKLWTVALERVAERLGGVLSGEARAAMIGQDIDDSIRMLIADVGSAAEGSVVRGMLLEVTAEVFRDGMPWQPGASALLDQVRAAGMSTALVTATYRSLVEIALETLGPERFDVLVCGDEVQRPKPDPEPYLRAMELLGVTAEQSLAVEDSPNGSRSAAAAGVPVLVVPSEVPVPPAPGLVFAGSLADVDVARLHQIHRERTGADTAVAG